MNTGKQALRGDVEALVQRYEARGHEVYRALPGESGNGYRHVEWSRAAHGLKVATGEEIAAERHRRALTAVGNKDGELALRILSYEFDAAIKFDIENDRLAPPPGPPPAPKPRYDVAQALLDEATRLEELRQDTMGRQGYDDETRALATQVLFALRAKKGAK